MASVPRIALLALIAAVLGVAAVEAPRLTDAARSQRPATVARSDSSAAHRGALEPLGSADSKRSTKLPTAAGLRQAWSYARGRGGLVSFAVVDSEGELRGRDVDRLYSAASTVKAMLLAAEIVRLERGGLPLDSSTDGLLDAMITYSDNAAADAVYARVGDAGMFEIARRAGMDGFTAAGHWGNAQVSAADLARLFFELDRLLEGPHREYALGLLGSVVSEQSWGIPAAAGPDWAVRFKGGWLPEKALAHQAAELRDGERRLSIAVLTDEQPSHAYATETVRGVAQRLLEDR